MPTAISAEKAVSAELLYDEGERKEGKALPASVGKNAQTLAKPWQRRQAAVRRVMESSA